MNERPAITAAAVSDQWIADARDAAQREGYAFRAAAGCTIEIKRDHTTWRHLTLPTTALRFINDAERNAVLAKLQRK